LAFSSTSATVSIKFDIDTALITPLPTLADRIQTDPSQTQPSQNNVDPASLLTFCKATAESQRLDILRVLSA
jgi:hypothetical protein